MTKPRLFLRRAGAFLLPCISHICCPPRNVLKCCVLDAAYSPDIKMENLRVKGGRLHVLQAGSAQGLFRLRRLSARSGAGGGRPAGGAGRALRHAHRRGQIPVLSAPRPDAARRGAGDLPPHLPDEGPGGQPGTGGRPGGLSEPLPHRAAVRPGPGAGLAGTVQDHLCGPRAAGEPRLPPLRPSGPYLPGGGGRGPLRLPVGHRLPPQLSGYPRLCGPAPPPPPQRGLYRHRHAGGTPGYSGQAPPVRPGDHHHRL